MDRLGIDIGSKTIKVVLLGEDGVVLHSDYVRHRSHVKPRLLKVLRDCMWRCGTRELAVTVTGSAGMRVSELFGIPHVQEVIALKRAVEHVVPGCDCVLEMGGEDTKLVYLSGVLEQRMNTVCAGGTGGFIDMMASLMGERVELMDHLARQATTVYPIASRCAVFAKSDVRPLLNAGAKHGDVAASVLEAVCTQAIAGLSAGRPIEGKVALVGGPFSYIPALRDAFVRVSGLPSQDVVVPQNAHLLVALGAALSPQSSEPMALRDLLDRIVDTRFFSEEGIGRLPPLFESEEEYAEFALRHEGCRVPQVGLENSTGNLFIGIDAGSTTMKVAMVDETGALCGYQYGWNQGSAGRSLPWMLKSLYRNIASVLPDEKVVRRSCVVGYGEAYCRAAFAVDAGEVETVAHLRAAREIEPQVDFVMDIGGQDIKCFYIEDGRIGDVVLNEACSSGCGSLFDDVARSMRKSKETFAAEALFASNPVDLGTRCATFMDSRVKHAQKDGVSGGDIAAGVAYATARNALFKVVRRPDFSSVGEHVVVQGGAFANEALLRAFELQTGRHVKRPDLAEIMGAWGAALLARDEWAELRARSPELAMRARSALLSEEALGTLEAKTQTLRCGLCNNKCKLVVTRFESAGGGERTCVTGNRCERGAAAYGVAGPSHTAPPNMFEVKRALIAQFDALEAATASQAAAAPRGVVGIPKVLALFESYPFWATMFAELGYDVITVEMSDDAVFREGMGYIPSEGACYPSKLVYGHVARLAAGGAGYIFLPFMDTGFAREGLLGTGRDLLERECPLVENMPQMVVDNMEGGASAQAKLLTPDFRGAAGLDERMDCLLDALQGAGMEVDGEALEAAVGKARAVYRGLAERMERARARTLERVDAGEFEGALVIGHAYHADPGIGHGVDLLLGKMGYAVLDRLPKGASAPGGGKGPDATRYRANSRLVQQVEGSASRPRLQCVVLRSFGCGVDAMAADEVYGLLRAQGRIYAELKLDQAVNLAAIRIRLRSLAYATRHEGGAGGGAGGWTLMSAEEAGRLAPLLEKQASRAAASAGHRKRGEARIKRASTTARVIRRADSATADAPRKDTGSAPASDKLKAGMARLGYAFIGFRPNLRGVTACIGFVREEAFEWFKSWDAVEAFLEEHANDPAADGDDAPRLDGPPAAPLPPGVA